MSNQIIQVSSEHIITLVLDRGRTVFAALIRWVVDLRGRTEVFFVLQKAGMYRRRCAVDKSFLLVQRTCL